MGVLYIVPSIRIHATGRGVHHTMLGMETNPNRYDAVPYTSPYLAYRKTLNRVLASEFERQELRRSAEGSPDLPLYLSDEFALVVFAVWLAVPLVIGYLRFEGTDLE